MNLEDFERLKAVCEKEGFDVSSYKEDTKLGMLIHVRSKKDAWERVEFLKSVWSGKVYPINQINLILRDGIKKDDWEPSTESAYIEQLKAEAFKRFGEIKEGDRFELPFGGLIHTISEGNAKFTYEKEFDWFFYRQVKLYDKGKWATRVPERVKVKNWSYRTEEKDGKIYHECVFICPIKEFDDDVHIFLVSQLEEYLNK